jgi:hypothetical protein
VAGASAAAPKNYVFTGKLTSNRAMLINIPVVGDTPCAGVGLSNLRIMSGPGLTGHSGLSMTMTMAPPPNMAGDPKTAFGRPNSVFANGFFADYQCAGDNAGKKVVADDVGIGGMGTGASFFIPTQAFLHPLPGMTTAIMVPNATPVIQLATSFKITGPKKVGTLSTSVTPAKSVTGAMTKWKNNFRKLHAGAYMNQPGRVQGANFTYCWGAPGCTIVPGGVRPLIVRYKAGANKFGGTMSYLITSGPNASSLALGFGGKAAFAGLAGMGSQVTGRGYAAMLTDNLAMGPLWNMYMLGMVTKPIVGMQTLITKVTSYLFPYLGGDNYNRGFPWTTGTVLARNTGTVAGNPRATTLSAMGGDTVTAMGKRNISLVAGGMANAVIGPLNSNTAELGQMYIPEPNRAAQLLAGVAALLGIAAWRSRQAR